MQHHHMVNEQSGALGNKTLEKEINEQCLTSASPEVLVPCALTPLGSFLPPPLSTAEILLQLSPKSKQDIIYIMLIHFWLLG